MNSEEIEAHVDPTGSVEKCRVCRRNIPSRIMKMIGHVRNDHFNGNVYHCHHCQFWSPMMKVVKRHSVKSHRGKPPKCDEKPLSRQQILAEFFPFAIMWQNYLKPTERFQTAAARDAWLHANVNVNVNVIIILRLSWRAPSPSLILVRCNVKPVQIPMYVHIAGHDQMVLQMYFYASASQTKWRWSWMIWWEDLLLNVMVHAGNQHMLMERIKSGGIKTIGGGTVWKYNESDN